MAGSEVSRMRRDIHCSRLQILLFEGANQSLKRLPFERHFISVVVKRWHPIGTAGRTHAGLFGNISYSTVQMRLYLREEDTD
jgi:hypothetical protein